MLILKLSGLQYLFRNLLKPSVDNLLTTAFKSGNFPSSEVSS